VEGPKACHLINLIKGILEDVNVVTGLVGEGSRILFLTSGGESVVVESHLIVPIKFISFDEFKVSKNQ